MSNHSITLSRVTSAHTAFVALVGLLDAELAERNGAEHSFYVRYNTIGTIRHAVLALDGEEAVGCGAIKDFAPGTMEVKRMYTLPNRRGKGVAAQVLGELERWAAELGATRCVLETGKKQPEAIALYLKSGYSVISNYGQYAGVENSVCFEKHLRPGAGG